MNKWILISIYNRELAPIRVFNTYEEAQAAMNADFIDSVGSEEFNKICVTNGEPYCDDWQLRDDDAWLNNGDTIDWYIQAIERAHQYEKHSDHQSCQSHYRYG